MKGYRIHKYIYDTNGRCDDWIAISDIGKEFKGKVLTVKDYKEIEDKYIKALYIILDYCGIQSVNIRNMMKTADDKSFLSFHKRYSELYDEKLLEFYYSLDDLYQVEYADIGNLCRLQLREDISSDIFYPRRLKILICYDFLMGIKSSRTLMPVIPEIEKLGLFVMNAGE